MSLIKKNFVYNNLLNITNIVIPLLVFPYISRILGPEKLGVVSFTISLVLTFGIVASLGLPIYGIREIAKVKNNKKNLSKTFSELFFLQLIWLVIATIIYGIWLYISDTLVDDNTLKLLSFFHLISLVGLLYWFYHGIENYKVITVTNLMSKLIMVVLTYVLIKEQEDYWLYYALTILAFFLSAFFNIVYAFKKVNLTTKELNFKRHFKAILILFATQIAIGIYVNFDIVFLGYLSTDTEVGYYTPANRIIKIALVFITSLGTILVPKITRFIKEKDFTEAKKTITKSLQFVALFALPFMFATYFLSEEIITIFAGKQYAKSVFLLQVATPLIFIIGLSNVFGIQVLVPYHKEKELMISVCIGVVFNIVLSLILIPKFNALGAVLVLIITEIIITLITYYFINKYKLVSFPLKSIFKYLLFALVGIPIFVFLKSYLEGFWYLFISFIVYTSMYICLLFLVKDDFFRNDIVQPLLKKLK